MTKDAIREAAEEAVEELGFSATHHVSKADAIEIVNSFIRAEVDAERERCISIISEECRSRLDILKACRDRIYEVPE